MQQVVLTQSELQQIARDISLKYGAHPSISDINCTTHANGSTRVFVRFQSCVPEAQELAEKYKQYHNQVFIAYNISSYSICGTPV